jgi:hypothetical protein
VLWQTRLASYKEGYSFTARRSRWRHGHDRQCGGDYATVASYVALDAARARSVAA